MQKNASLFGWVVESARWLILISAALILATGGPLGPMNILLLILAAAWSTGLTLLASIGRNLPGQPWIKVGGDAILSLLLFLANGQFSGPLSWIGILPVWSAALHFNLWGGILSALGILAMHGMSAWLLSGRLEPTRFILQIGFIAGLYLGSGIVLPLFVRLFWPGLLPPARPGSKGNRVEKQDNAGNPQDMYTLIAKLSSELNTDHVLETALSMASASLETSDLVSAAFIFPEENDDHERLLLAAEHNLHTDTTPIYIPVTEGVIGQALNEGNAVYSGDMSKETALAGLETLRNCRSAGLLPLRSGIKSMGILLFAHPQGRFFSTERREVVEIIAHQTAIALNNARLYSNLEQEKRHIAELQEESRKRLARDLHDGPTQSIAAIAMRVNFAKRLLNRDEKAAAEELFKIEELARRTTKEIRNMLFTMRPVILETEGLEAALQAMADKMRDVHNQNVIIQVDKQTINRLDTNKAAVLYYIVEEAVNNARKHAQAAQINVRLRPLKGDLCLLEIQDDGLGFNLGQVNTSYEDRGSLGMVNMRERAEALAGVLHITSEEGIGTHIQVAIPLTAESAARLRKLKSASS